MNERTLFLEALEQDGPAKRSAYLEAACAGDSALRFRVEALLKSHEGAGSFLGRLAPERLANDMGVPGATDEMPEKISAAEGGPALGFLAPSDRPGSHGRLGSHEIEEVIGQGGMGIVLRAFDERLHRAVAIKVMSPTLASNEHARRRFVREGRAAAAVRDDHVIGIHGVDETNGLPFLVMEYIVGRSLAQRIEAEGPLPVTDVLRIGGQIARGLAAAHAQGLVHRDIKPANILLENGVERVKITDFGLAHAVDDVRTTQPGTVVGTPEYMSPEQARGEKVDHRSDLFSLGCVLYAMCAGRPPFRAESTVAIIRRVCDDTPRPLVEINPEVPEWLVHLIDKLIAKDAGERFQSAGEVAELLGQYLAHVQQPAVNPQPAAIAKLRTVGRKNSANARRRWSIAAAAVLLLGAGLSLAESTGVTCVTVSVIRIFRGDGTLVVEVGDPSIKVSVDGEELVITGAGPQEFRLRPGQHELHAVKDGKPVETKLVTITRDGREVVKVAREQATSASAAPTNRLVWANVADWTFSGVPSPDGKFLSYVDWQKTGDIGVHELATGKDRNLTNQGWPEYGSSPIFSPDTKQVAYSWWNKDKVYELRLIGLEGSEPRVLYPNKEKEVRYLETSDWSADGNQILAFFSKKGTGQTGEIVSISVVDGSVRVLKTLDWGSPGKMRLSPDGRYVAYSLPPEKTSRKRDIFLLATDGSGEVPLAAHPADDFVLGWSPDGKRLLFASDRTGSTGAWLMTVAQGKPQGTPELVKPEMGKFHALGLTRNGSFYYGLFSGGQNVYTATLDLAQGKLATQPVVAIQRGEGFNWAPAWSPDGRYLACLVLPIIQAKAQLFYIRSVESKEVRELTSNFGGFNVHSLHWSPDGQALLGAGTNEEGDWGAQRIDVQTGNVATLVQGGGVFAPIPAPDGKTLFFQRNNPPRRLIRRDIQTGVEQELYRTTDRAQGWTLSPDGRQLAFVVAGALKLLPATGGEPQELVKGDGTIRTVAWTPDGRQLLFQRVITVGTEGVKRPELWRILAAGGEPQKLDVDLPALEHLRIHPDGRQIAFSAHSPQRDKCEIWALENFLPPLADSKPPAAADASGAKSE